MSNEPVTIRVFVPLTFKKRNGRPKILPPADVEALIARRQEPHVLRAIGRAWGWRRKLEKGEFATIQQIADKEKISDRFVARMIRLAYLSPAVLQRLVIYREPLPLPLNALSEIAVLAWSQQMTAVFGREEQHID